MHAKLGPKWCEITKHIDGRTDNAVKNRFNSNLKRQLKYGMVIPTYGRVSKSKAFSDSRSETADA